MHKKMTITLDEYALDNGYKAMSGDPDREAEAIEWVAGMGSAANRDDAENAKCDHESTPNQQ